MVRIPRVHRVNNARRAFPILPVLLVFPWTYPKEMSLIKKSIRMKVIGL